MRHTGIQFIEKIKELVSINKDEEDLIKSHFIHRKIRRKQYLLQAGDVCKTMTFVEKGMLRLYSVDEKGQEHILQFAPEDWTINDMNSFINGVPSIYNIDVLEDAEVVLMTNQSKDEIIKHVPQFGAFTRLQLTGAYAAMQKRITVMQSFSPEEKYQYFISLYPHITQRVPQHMIASYLGLTRETLSRVRRRLFTHK